MNVILGTAFSLTLGVWRLRVRIAIEDTALPDARRGAQSDAAETF
jgi:hypothetical protein